MRLPHRPARLATLAGPLLALAVLAAPPRAARAQDEPAEAGPAAERAGPAPAEHRPARHEAADAAEPRHGGALAADATATPEGTTTPRTAAPGAAASGAAGHASVAAQAGAHAAATPDPHAPDRPTTLATLRAALQPRAPDGAEAQAGERRPVLAAARAPAAPSGSARILAPVRPASAASAPGLVGHTAGPGSFLGTPALPAAPLPAGPLMAEPLDAGQVEAEVGRLRIAMAAEVPGTMRPAPDMARHWIALLRPALAGQNAPTHPQLVVVVDRNTRVQEAALVMVRPQGSWEMIGATHVSTGQAGRWDHYITPVGVFPHTDLILDYRAEGTYNENHIRGLGVKGMRVWDFGWQWAHRGWGEDQSPIQIRMEMHATDPAILAQRIGHTASQGCIRIPEALNRFLDHRGVLDADYERAAVDDIRYRALLPKDRVPTTLAGDTLVVVDSSGAT